MGILNAMKTAWGGDDSQLSIRSCRQIRSAVGRVLVGCAVSCALVFALVLPASATDAFPTTDDHSTTIATPWWWYYNVTSAQVASLASQNHARLTQIRIDDPSVPTFDVTMVANSGAYASGWWWYFGVTAAQVDSFLTQNNARLTALRPYMDNGQRVFAVIMVSNTGADNKPWRWFAGATINDIASRITSENMRVVAFTPDPAGGFDSIMVGSEGET